MTSRPRILHCFGHVDALTAENLSERIETLGGDIQHCLAGLSVEQIQGASQSSLLGRARLVQDFPDLAGKPWPRTLSAIAQAAKPYDLICSYGWGAINVALAHTLFGEAMGLPPLIHHETHLQGEESGLSRGRTWMRRIALARASALVVPTERLEGHALTDWQQPMGRVKRFPPGATIPSVAVVPRSDAVQGVIKRDGELWIGARLDRSADVHAHLALVEGLTELPEAWHLVFLNDGLDLDLLVAHAERREVAHRLHTAQAPADLSAVMGLFDLWAVLSKNPGVLANTLVAMANARAVIAEKFSGANDLLSPDNQRVAAADLSPNLLGEALITLAEDDGRRSQLGASNFEFAREQYDNVQAVDRYRRLYASTIGVEIKA